MRRYLSCLALILVSVLPTRALTFDTSFTGTESPISEGGTWINGGTTGLLWSDCAKTGGLAYGLQDNGASYADATAIRTGSWGPDQTVVATIKTTNQSGSTSDEAEIRLRSTVTANSNTGYELVYGLHSDGTQYVAIVKWLGGFGIGQFTVLVAKNGSGEGAPAINDGDIAKGTIVGSTISLYLNNTLYLSTTDSTYTSGSPGMGFQASGGTLAHNQDYGFTHFNATDGISSATLTVTGVLTVQTIAVN